MEIKMEHITKVAFPGLGIGEFQLDNVAFEIFGFPVYWYGVIITMGIIVAFIYAWFRGKNEGVNLDNIVDVALISVVLAIIGARLYFVLSKPEDFFVQGDILKTLKNIIDIRSGGLGIYGGVFGGIVGVIGVTLIKKINPLKVLDMGAPGLMFAQAMGRWGNFMNGEAYGGLVEEGHPLYFLRMSLQSNNTMRDKELAEVLGGFPQGMVDVHPTFFYESMWNILGFVLINIFYKKKKFNGQILCMYLAWYGIGRFFIEWLRTDSLFIPNIPVQIKVSQLVGILCFVIFGAVIVAGLIYAKKRLYASNANLSALEKNFIKPNIIDRPAFFEKTENSDKKSSNIAVNCAPNEISDKTESEQTLSEEENKGEEDNGTNN